MFVSAYVCLFVHTFFVPISKIDYNTISTEDKNDDTARLLEQGKEIIKIINADGDEVINQKFTLKDTSNVAELIYQRVGLVKGKQDDALYTFHD